MEQLSFFFRHAFLHLLRERQRTLFVIFCIAVGVAAVVALRTLGLMMQDALTGNLQAGNRGDLSITMPSSVEADDTTLMPDGTKVKINRSLFEIEGETGQNIYMSRTGQVRLQNWAAAHSFEIQFSWNNLGPFTPAHKIGGSEGNSYIMIYGVDPARYPFYDTITLMEPLEMPLKQALSEPHHVVVSDSLASELDLRPGDNLSIAGAPGIFTVSGIVSLKSQSGLSDDEIFAAMFPFLYMPYETAIDAFHQQPIGAAVRVPSGTDLAATKVEFLKDFPGMQARTPDDLRRINEGFSSTITRLATVVGLASLLIGGIGIANTMLVAISRRTLEIAVLKTVGVQGSQIVLMFMVEALMLGAVGSTVGVVLGQGLAFLLRDVGERFSASTLPYAVYPEALIIGWLLGIVITLVFGFLPILDASHVRPNVVLSPQNASKPASAWLVSAVVLMLLTAIIGMIVGQIVGNWLIGIGLAYATLVVLGLSTLGLSLAVWLASRLPSFGSISLKLAQRAIGAQRDRAASTLLALVIGLFSLGTIWLLAQGTLDLVAGSAKEMLGGDILVTVTSVESGQDLERKLDRVAGVTYAHDDMYNAEIIAINGVRDMEDLVEQAKQRARTGGVIGADADIDGFVHGFKIKEREADNLPYKLALGTDIAGDSREEILLEDSVMDEAYKWFDLKPGDRLTLRFSSGARRIVQIVGVTLPRSSGPIMAGLVAFREANGIVPSGVIPTGAEPIPSAYIITTPPSHLSEIMDLLGSTPGVYMVSTEQLTAYARRAVEQFTPLVLIAAGMALFASSVIIANTVSLTTMERRRQIGIMKALGLQAESVLGLLLLENGLVGLAGGLLGAGLSIVTIVGSGALGDGSRSMPYVSVWTLVLMGVVLSLVATLITAWGASREKPLNVLRYE